MYNDDDFNFNHGLSLAATRNYKAAEEALLLVHNEKYKQEYVYIGWLARCYIMNGNPRSAWELYLKLTNSSESFNLLQLLANDCYKMGHFLFAAKAFDVLERLDPDPEYWEGKRGACVGVFQVIFLLMHPLCILTLTFLTLCILSSLTVTTCSRASLLGKHLETICKMFLQWFAIPPTLKWNISSGSLRSIAKTTTLRSSNDKVSIQGIEYVLS